MENGVPVDFGITSDDRDFRDNLPSLAERGDVSRFFIGDKGYISQHPQAERHRYRSIAFSHYGRRR